MTHLLPLFLPVGVLVQSPYATSRRSLVGVGPTARPRDGLNEREDRVEPVALDLLLLRLALGDKAAYLAQLPKCEGATEVGLSLAPCEDELRLVAEHLLVAQHVMEHLLGLLGCAQVHYPLHHLGGLDTEKSVLLRDLVPLRLEGGFVACRLLVDGAILAKGADVTGRHRAHVFLLLGLFAHNVPKWGLPKNPPSIGRTKN